MDSNILLLSLSLFVLYVAQLSWCYQSPQGVKINYREKEKEVLDQILGPSSYDARIRPSGENGTDGPTIVHADLLIRNLHIANDKMVCRKIVIDA
ncbi:hypothetical protein M8J75_001167 [Diaphorina citri]|nr:hypothetical protein M8J75_001167 [Diaphorina citri]